MARMPRVVVPLCPHHVTQRGSRRQPTFFRDDDYRVYLRLMAERCRRAGTRVWAYCLMPNHVHLVMVPSHQDGLRAALGEAHRRYSRIVNLRMDWQGHLWQERFHSVPVDERHLLAAVRYVERNPVAARLCAHPRDWPWSSAPAHLQGRDDVLVEVGPMLSRVSDWGAYLAGPGDEDIGARLSRHARTGRPLGDARFVERLERITGRVLTPRPSGRRPKTRPE